MSPHERSPIDVEIDRLDGLLDAMLLAYTQWGTSLEMGEVHFNLYDEYWEFVNLRMQTARACRTLIQGGFVADALGRMRTLLEGYLLLRLMSRGRKAFRTQDLSGLPKADFKQRLEAVQTKWREEQAAGVDTWLDIREHPRRRGRIQYIYEGLKVEGDNDLMISIQWAAFQQYRPETARLKPDEYFKYYELDQTHKQIRAVHKKNAGRLYDDFLSYAALLDSLELNELMDVKERARVEAHYTFLGKFVHLTNGAERNLCDESNVHYGGTGIGLKQPYSRVAVLLAHAYLVFLVAGFLEEIISLIDRAPSEHIQQPQTERLSGFVEYSYQSIRYFWFIYNEASNYDKYEWAIPHATEDQLEQAGGYEGLSSSLITFEAHIFERFSGAFGSWDNLKCGAYRPPLPGG